MFGSVDVKKNTLLTIFFKTDTKLLGSSVNTSGKVRFFQPDFNDASKANYQTKTLTSVYTK